MPSESSLLINLNEVLSFFDEKPDWAERHSAAVVAMLFEDLATATLDHCLRCNGATEVNIRPEPVTTGQKKGPWLDRWIEADLANGQSIIFQTEIKSLSAHSTGHQTIALDATEDKLNPNPPKGCSHPFGGFGLRRLSDKPWTYSTNIDDGKTEDPDFDIQWKGIVGPTIAHRDFDYGIKPCAFYCPQLFYGYWVPFAVPSDKSPDQLSEEEVAEFERLREGPLYLPTP